MVCGSEQEPSTSEDQGSGLGKHNSGRDLGPDLSGCSLCVEGRQWPGKGKGTHGHSDGLGTVGDVSTQTLSLRGEVVWLGPGGPGTKEGVPSLKGHGDCPGPGEAGLDQGRN